MDAVKTYSNYVIYFPSTQRLKIGVTGNFKSRVKFYRQEAARHGLGYVACSRGELQYKTVARLVEQSICDAMKPAAMPKTREWFEGDEALFEAFKVMTRRIQDEVKNLFQMGIE